jgi:hypothetical protein
MARTRKWRNSQRRSEWVKSTASAPAQFSL